jgi:hypothetical protein
VRRIVGDLLREVRLAIYSELAGVAAAGEVRPSQRHRTQKERLAGITSLAAAIIAMRRAFRMEIGAYRDQSRDASDVRLGCVGEGMDMVLVVKTRALYQFTVVVSIPTRYRPSRYCGSRVARAMMQGGAGISRMRQSALTPVARITTPSHTRRHFFSDCATAPSYVGNLNMTFQNFVWASAELKDAVMLPVWVSSNLAPRIDVITGIAPDRKRLVCDPCSYHHLLFDSLTDCRPIRAPMKLSGNNTETSVSRSKQRVHRGCEPWFVYPQRQRFGCVNLIPGQSRFLVHLFTGIWLYPVMQSV